MAVVRALVALALLGAGALSAVAAVAVHGRWWGLALAAAAVMATLLAVGPGWSTRLAFAVGFAAVVLRLALSRPEGDFVLAGDLQGYLLLLLTLAVAGLALGTLPRPFRARPRMSADGH
jgi:hypothetical protein